MTQFRYVRIQPWGPQGPGSCSTPIFGVMPARLLLIGLLFQFSSISGQPFLHSTCDSSCLPAFDAVPEDVTVSCLEAFPDFTLPGAEACADSPIENTPSVELDVTSVTSHSATTAFGDGPDWAIWLGGFEAMGHGASDYFVPYGDGIVFEQFANGTARFTGEIVNDTDPGQRFELNIFLQYGQDYDSWTAQGRLPKDDLGLGAYEDWMFYEMVDTLSHMAGRGDFEGGMLYLDHMPVSRLFGYQVGDLGANNRNPNYGVSGWFWYRGVLGGQDVLGTGDVNADLEDTATDGVECPVVEELHRIAMAWSACGHDYYEQTLQRLDEEAPEFISMPPLATASCPALLDTASMEEFELYDACGSALTLTNSDIFEGDFCNQTVYRTWTLTDACGNSTDSTQTVVLVDETGPVVEAGNDLTVQCDGSGNADELADWLSSNGGATATDDCSAVTWSNDYDALSDDCGATGSVTVTFTATDDCDNSTSTSAVFSIIDTIAPDFSGSDNQVSMACDLYDETALYDIVVDDICGFDSVYVSSTLEVSGSCSPNYLRTYTAVDACGNSSTFEQSISLIDTVAPVFTFVPESVTLDCSEEWPDPMDDAALMATAEDNCAEVTVTWADETQPGDCPGSTILERTFTATDECGNASTVVQTLVTEDTTAPEITSDLSDLTIACGDDIPELEPTATDDCSGIDSLWMTVESIDFTAGDEVSTGFESCNLSGFVAEGGSISITNDAFEGSCALNMLHAAGEPIHNFYPEDVMAGRGAYSVMARADDFISDNVLELLAGDAAGSPALTITLRPLGTDNPGIAVTGFGVDVATDATMQQGEWYEVVAVLGEATLSLSIDGASVLEVDLPADLPEQGRFKLASAYSGSFDNMSYLPEDPCPVVEQFMRTVYAVDGCGNEASASQIISVIDTVAPVLTFVPADADIDCSEEFPMPEDGAEWMATAEDACTDVTVTWSDEVVPNACPGSSTLYRTFTATDACGNATSAMQTIAQSDTEAPQLDEGLLPEDELVSCDAVPAPLDSSAFGATDNCNDWTFEYSEEIQPGSCAFDYVRIDTYTFTDCDGNATVFVHTLDVEDVTAPSFTFFPEDVDILCTEDFPMPEDGAEWMATAEDNCSDVTVTWEDVVEPNACPGSSTLMRTFTAVDACGNATSQTQTIAQYDDEAPQLNEDLLPEDVLVDCDDVPTTLESADFEVTDNCNTWSFEVESDTTELDPCGAIYTRVDTYTFTDCDGNATVFVHTVEVQDTTPPMFLYFPEDDSLACTEEYPLPTDGVEWLATAEDNCASVDISWTDEIVPGDCPGEDTLYRTFTALDACGNASTEVHTLFRYDDVAPEIGVFPNDTTIDCDPANEIPTLDSSYFAVTDNCNPWTFDVSTEYDGDPDTSCFYTRFDTYVFTDCSGNATSYVHVISVQDTTGPEITNDPIDLFLECPQEVPEFNTNEPLAAYADLIESLSITDACNGDLSVLSATYEDEVTVSVDATHYTMVRHWVFTDQCGNETAYDQIIDVNEPDLELPNAFSPGGNGYNDVYVIGNLGTTNEDGEYFPPCDWGGDDESVYFQVFNRWGSLVYSSPPGEEYQNDWDGRTNEDGSTRVVDGTYFVLLQLGDGRQWGKYVDVRND